MKTRRYMIFTACLFALLAIAHLLRLTLGWSAQLGTWSVPLWLSVVAVLVCGMVATWGFVLARRI